jgi:hypothetical protein
MEEYHILQEIELIEEDLLDIQHQIDNDFQTEESMKELRKMKRMLQQKSNKLNKVLDFYK